jgi:Transposase, Mutator family
VVVENNMDALGSLRKHLESADTDLLREMVQTFAEALMAAEADAICGAGYRERSPERVNSRNGYRLRDFDTRVGSMELAIPKLRAGSYFPDWLVEPRRRGERALVAVVAECYVRGVSTRRVEGLVNTLGDRAALQVPGLRARQQPRRRGRGVPEPAPRRRALHLCVARRADPEVRASSTSRSWSPLASTSTATARSWAWT